MPPFPHTGAQVASSNLFRLPRSDENGRKAIVIAPSQTASLAMLRRKRRKILVEEEARVAD